MREILSKTLTQKIHQAIKKGLFPGCVIGVIRKHSSPRPAGRPGKFERMISYGGHFRYPDYKHPYITAASNPEIKPDTIFDCASLTKVIPTSFLALQLLEKGEIALEDKLIKYLPPPNPYELDKSPSENFRPNKNEIRIKHLLTQTLNFDLRLADLKYQSPPEILKSILKAPLKEAAGTSVNYCNATSILLGLVIEKVTGKKLYELAETEIFDPLNMRCSSFLRPKHQLAEFGSRKKSAVPTELNAWRKRELQGEIHDESAWMLSKIIDPGSAGLFSNVPDLLNFLEMILNNGKFQNNKFLKSATIKNTYGFPVKESTLGLGFELNQPWMGHNRSSSTIGKTGFTGCSLLAAIEHGIGLIILSNYTWPHRRLTEKGQADKHPINEFRAQIADLILQK